MLRKMIFVARRSSLVSRIIPGAISGILLAFSFSSFNLSFLVWSGLVPLFFVIQDLNPKQAFYISYLCGFLFFLSSMYWLIYIAPTGWILLSLYQAIYFGIFALSCQYLVTTYTLPPSAKASGGGQLTTYISIPSLWCLLEYVRSHLGGGIGWNLLGYSQYQNIPIIQIADITGAYGVSFLIVMVNFTVYSGIKMAIRCQKTHKSLFVKSTLPFKEEIKINPLLQTLAVFFILVFVLAYGYKRIEVIDTATASSAKQLKISIIQGNIAQPHKWDPSYKDHIIKKYERLTLEAAKDKPELIIWPETSVPGYLNEDKTLLKYIQNLARRTKSFLLVGAPMAVKEGPEEIADYNSAILFSKKGRLSQQYNKLRLVLFGEYIPFEKQIPFLRNILPLTGAFIPGSEYTTFRLTTYNLQLTANFGVLICFEDIFPAMVRHFVKEKADFMVNITNDAWFGKSAAAYQHTANSVFRTVENRRPFVRSANTGLSCFIDRVGRIYNKVSSGGQDLFTEGYATDIVKIAPDSTPTFYTRYGDIFAAICAVITGLFLIDYLRRRRYNK